MSAPGLAALRGFVFDLDGCVWAGDALAPGAGETLAALRRAGRRTAFVSNNSRARGGDLRGRLERLGVATDGSPVLTPLEVIGRVIAERYGPSDVLVIGAAEMAAVIVDAGHRLVDVADFRRASVVAVGNDFDLSYARLAAASRAAAGGAPLVTPNVDPRLPIEDGDFLPGCGAIVEAVAVAAGVRPLVVGKPAGHLFRLALDGLGLGPAETAMVGDSVESDVAGGRAAGMRTVLYAPGGAARDGTGADVVVRSFGELGRLAGVNGA